MVGKNTLSVLVSLFLLVGCIQTLEMQGISFVGMPYTRIPLGDYRAKLSLERLKSTGANWISIPVTFFQDFKNSSLTYLGIQPFLLESGVNEAPQEKDLISIISEAKRLDLRVML